MYGIIYAIKVLLRFIDFTILLLYDCYIFIHFSEEQGICAGEFTQFSYVYQETCMMLKQCYISFKVQSFIQ